MSEVSSERFLIVQLSEFILWGILAFAVTFIAWIKGFFYIKPAKENGFPIKLQQVVAIFTIYFTITFIFSPLIANIARLILVKMKRSEIVFSLAYFGWINIVITLTLLTSFIYFSYKIDKKTLKGIWKNSSSSSTLFFDTLIGFLSWIIVFPIILFFSHLFDIFIYLIFKISKLPDQAAVRYLKMTYDHPFFFYTAIIMMVVCAPFIEELLFRGFLQNWIKKNLGRGAAILLTSCCFAFFHFALIQGYGNITIIGSLFILACFLGILYERQKSLLSPIVLHATFNLFSLINLVFVKGLRG